jgi:pimeloyl-ACP methyl ester carboxylesterase
MRRLKIGDRVLRLRDEPEVPGKRTPLVCVHGAVASSVLFVDLVRRYKSGRRVVAIDLPGHGQSDRWHPPEDVSIEMYRDAVGTACKTLGIERAILVGHSMGAQVALACAAAWPERVAELVLVGAAVTMPVEPRFFAELRADYLHFAEWYAPLAWSPATPRDTVERWARLLVQADQEIALADFQAVARFDAAPLLPRLKAPALVIGGADDLLVPPRRVSELAAALKAPLHLLDAAGHLPLLEAPEAFYRALDGFLLNA